MNGDFMNRRKGFAIIYTLLFVLLLVLILTAFSSISYNSLITSGRTCDMVRAHYIAEAGLAKKFMDLRSGNMSSASGTFTISTGRSGTYSVTITGSAPVYTLTSTGTYHNTARTVVLTLRQISCARYAYLSDSEDQLIWHRPPNPIWFTTGDILTGPVYTNDQFNISGNPIFEGPVSSVASTINYYHGGPPADNPEFRDSLTLGAPAVVLPSYVNNIRSAAQASDGLYLTGNTVVTLLPNGTMNVTNQAKNWINHNTAIPANNALFVSNGYVDVSGTLNGQLTVGTNNNIYVVNNLLYNSDPRVTPTSTDMLSLVSQNNVYVDSNAPYDLEIDAYIIALNSSFTVENYDTVLKGTLTIYGGMTQERRGPVGTFNAQTDARISGYTKNYIYDERFMDAAPPYFAPLVDASGRIVYVKVSWHEL